MVHSPDALLVLWLHQNTYRRYQVPFCAPCPILSCTMMSPYSILAACLMSMSNLVGTQSLVATGYFCVTRYVTKLNTSNSPGTTSEVPRYSPNLIYLCRHSHPLLHCVLLSAWWKAKWQIEREMISDFISCSAICAHCRFHPADHFCQLEGMKL